MLEVDIGDSSSGNDKEEMQWSSHKGKELSTVADDVWDECLWSSCQTIILPGNQSCWFPQ